MYQKHLVHGACYAHAPFIVLVILHYPPLCQHLVWGHGGSPHVVTACHQHLSPSAKGCVGCFLVFTGYSWRLTVCLLFVWVWLDLLSFMGGAGRLCWVCESVGVKSSRQHWQWHRRHRTAPRLPAHPPAFTLTLIQTEKTTHSSDTNSVTWELSPSPAGN